MLTVRPLPLLAMPPPWLAELLAKVLVLMVTVPLSFSRPPPRALPAELLAKVLFVIFTVPMLKRPPPPKRPELLAKVLLLMLTVPLFSRPPPPPVVEPWAMVRALSVKVTPLFTDKTRTLSPPERVTCWPLPSRVRFLLITSVWLRVIVPLQPKLMVSPLAALAIALCNWLSSVQSVMVTVLSDWAWAILVASPRLASTPTPSNRASPTRRAQDERRMVCG